MSGGTAIPFVQIIFSLRVPRTNSIKQMIILYLVTHQIRFASNQVTFYKLKFTVTITDYDKNVK